MNVASLVDTDRWPMNDDALTSQLNQAFVDENIVVLPGFIKPSALPALVAECDELAKVAYHTTVNANLEVVAYDQFPNDSLLLASWVRNSCIDMPIRLVH
jgi:hypothetical protein